MRIGDNNRHHFVGQEKTWQIAGYKKQFGQAKPMQEPMPAPEAKLTPESAPPPIYEVEDTLEISAETPQEAYAAGEKRGRADKAEADMATLLEQLENAKAQGEAMGDMMREKIKCLRIAISIMAGDKVPNADLRYLAEKDPDLYGRALSMRMENKAPQQREQVSEEEKADGAEEGGEAAADGESVETGESAEPEAAPPASEGAAAEAAPAAAGGGNTEAS